MDYVRVGASGLKVSRLCLGMMSYGDTAARAWHLDEDAARPIVRAAVDAGVTFFDTADVYSGGESERITGRLLASLFGRREDYVLATKVGLPVGAGPNEHGLSRAHVLAGIDASLARLGVDHVDLYQIHRFDEQTPIGETMAALEDVVRSGKARYIGASSMAAWQFASAQHAAVGTRFVSMQNHYNLVYREEEREMIPLCVAQGVGVLPYSPLARGLLARTGPTSRAGSDPVADGFYDGSDLDVVAAVRALGTARGLPPAQVALAWLLGRPGVDAPVVGATRTAHLADAVAALDVRLDEEEVARLEAPYRPHRVLR